MARLMAEGGLPGGVRTIWLTPLLRDPRVASALHALDQPGLLVIGDRDPFLEPELLDRLSQRGTCRSCCWRARTTGSRSTAISPRPPASWSAAWPPLDGFLAPG